MADLVFERCLPSERAREIRALFHRAAKPEFDRVFERVYTVREPEGLRSWVGLDDTDALLHVSVSPQPFSGAPHPLVAGLPGDLMADERQRDFWGPLKLVRRMVADIRAARTVDFLVTSYVPNAEGVFKGAGFKPFAEIRRYVMPLLWPYPLLRRLQHRQPVPRLIAIPFHDGADVSLSGLESPGEFRPSVTPAFYATRMPREQYPAGTWLVAGPPAAPEAVVLVSPQPNRELLIVDALWRGAQPRAAGLFSAVAKWAARNRYRRLSISTIPGSRMAVGALQAGFLERPGAHRVMMLAIAAPERIPAPEKWAFTPFVLTGW